MSFDTYREWNAARLGVLCRHFGSALFTGRTVLVVACGDAQIAGGLLAMGAIVDVSDGRPEYVENARSRFPDLRRAFVQDLDAPWGQHIGGYDILVHFGVLYHLRRPDVAIDDMMRHGRTVLLESEVDEQHATPIARIEGGFDQALNGTGSRFSRRFVEQCLSRHGWWTRIVDAALNVRGYDYTWSTSAGASIKRQLWCAWPRIPSKR